MSDQEIIELIRSGSKTKAFEKVYGSFPMVRKLVLSGGGSADDAKDIFQDAIIVFYRLAIKPDFVLSASISTLLYSIAQKLWLKKYRDYDSRRTGITEENQAASEDYETNAEEEELEKIRMSEKVLNGLGEPCSSLLKMFYFEKMSMSEIASRLGYSNENTAKAQKYKCIERGKRILLEHLTVVKTVLK